MSGVKNMTVGSPAKLFLAFSLPLMIGNIFQQLYTVVDTMVVGQVLGTTALAALGTTDWFNWMFLGIMSGLTQGFSILIVPEIWGRRPCRNAESHRKCDPVVGYYCCASCDRR